jgi:hypothetical protein
MNRTLLYSYGGEIEASWRLVGFEKALVGRVSDCRGRQGTCGILPKLSTAIECRSRARPEAVRGGYDRGLGFVPSLPRAHDR